MKKIDLLILILLSFSVSPIASAEEGVIESNSCRLANLYTKDAQVYGAGYSKGVRYNGKYPTAENATECELKCKKELVNRIETLPKGLKLEVECFYGKKQLFKKTFMGK
jgi:hypothetical protein